MEVYRDAETEIEFLRRRPSFSSSHVEKPYQIILLHGYGANMHDLAPLESMLDPERKHDWFFLNGVSAIDMPGYEKSRMWFPISIERLQLLSEAQGLPHEIALIREPALPKLSGLIARFFQSQNIDLSRSILGGFSQGAILSSHVALHLNLALKGLWFWSGSLFEAEFCTEKLHSIENPNPPHVLMSHGRFDPILPFGIAKKNFELWRESKVYSKSGQDRVQMLAFDGGHEIPPQVLAASRAMLTNLSS